MQGDRRSAEGVRRTARQRRLEGIRALPAPLAFYASTEVHSCVQKTLEILGLGSTALRKVPVDSSYRIETRALERMIAADRKAGVTPACVIGNAGTINTVAARPVRGWLRDRA